MSAINDDLFMDYPRMPPSAEARLFARDERDRAASAPASPPPARRVDVRVEVLVKSPSSPMPAPSPAPAPVGYAYQLRERFWKLKESRIRVNGPAMSSRASSLGNECERALFYERTLPSAERVAHGAGTQAIFDLGNAAERYVVRELEDMGAEIVQRGRDYLDRVRELSGHTDVRVRLPDWPRALITEVKGLNPFSAGRIETLDDIRFSPQRWIRRYYAQLEIYIGIDAVERGIPVEEADPGLFVLLNKSTGVIGFLDCPADPPTIVSLFAKAERIRDAVRADAQPDRNPSDDCARCPFVAVCAPPHENGLGVRFLASEELASLLARREALVEGRREFERVDEEAKALLPDEVGEYIAGDFVVKVTEQHWRALPAKPASTRIVRKIERLGGTR